MARNLPTAALNSVPGSLGRAPPLVVEPDDEGEDGEGDPRAQVGHVRLDGHEHGQAEWGQPLRRQGGGPLRVTTTLLRIERSR